MGDINNRNDDIVAIRKALGLEESKCRITHPNSFYVIQPINRNERLHIAHIANFNIFNRYNLSFKNCVFKCEVFLGYKVINTILNFQRCIFKKYVSFQEGIVLRRISFNDTIFKNIVYFIDSAFKKDVDFSRSRFKERAFFSRARFEQKAIFSEVIFDHNAHFDGARFQRGVDFSLSEFYQNAHFYQTIFKNDRHFFEKEEPNFKQVILNGYINLTHTRIFDFNFEQLKPEIQTSSDAKEFRNIFKNIKNALIKDNNLLDASRLHKMELYAKEIELGYKREMKAKTSRHWNIFVLLLNNGKDFID